MTCSEWLARIAEDPAEDPDPAGTAAHLSVCERCREFARELAANTAALRSMDVDAAAYAAVRARVMDAVTPRRRFGWRWTAAAVCAALVTIVSGPVLWRAMAPAASDVQPPAAITFRIEPPGLPIPVAKRAERRRRSPRVRQPQPLVAIKLLTDDPNVVIIWLVNKQGDSL